MISIGTGKYSQANKKQTWLSLIKRHMQKITKENWVFWGGGLTGIIGEVFNI